MEKDLGLKRKDRRQRVSETAVFPPPVSRPCVGTGKVWCCLSSRCWCCSALPSQKSDRRGSLALKRIRLRRRQGSSISERWSRKVLVNQERNCRLRRRIRSVTLMRRRGRGAVGGARTQRHRRRTNRRRSPTVYSSILTVAIPPRRCCSLRCTGRLPKPTAALGSSSRTVMGAVFGAMAISRTIREPTAAESSAEEGPPARRRFCAWSIRRSSSSSFSARTPTSSFPSMQANQLSGYAS